MRRMLRCGKHWTTPRISAWFGACCCSIVRPRSSSLRLAALAAC